MLPENKILSGHLALLGLGMPQYIGIKNARGHGRLLLRPADRDLKLGRFITADSIVPDTGNRLSTRSFFSPRLTSQAIPDSFTDQDKKLRKQRGSGQKDQSAIARASKVSNTIATKVRNSALPLSFQSLMLSVNKDAIKQLMQRGTSSTLTAGGVLTLKAATLNRYMYVNGNPVNATDLTGHFLEGIIAKLKKAVVSIITGIVLILASAVLFLIGVVLSVASIAIPALAPIAAGFFIGGLLAFGSGIERILTGVANFREGTEELFDKTGKRPEDFGVSSPI